MRILFIISTVFFASCAGTKNNNQISLRDKFNAGMENLEEKKYLQAQSDFRNVIIRGMGTDLGDDAQYYLGEAYFKNEEYLLAIAEYEKLTRKMGFSPFVEDARFKICEAYSIESPKYYHDQEYTRKALERYQEFLDDFPNSTLLDSVLISIGSLREKLAKKAFETGVLYLKMEEYDSAKLSFQVVINEFYDTPYLAEAQREMIVALAKNREIENAISFLTINETSLSRNGFYNEMAEFIDDMKLKLQKEQE